MSLHLYISQLYGRRVSKHNFARCQRHGFVTGTKAHELIRLIKKYKKGVDYVTPTSD